MDRIAPDIRPFLYPVSELISGFVCWISDQKKNCFKLKTQDKITAKHIPERLSVQDVWTHFILCVKVKIDIIFYVNYSAGYPARPDIRQKRFTGYPTKNRPDIRKKIDRISGKFSIRCNPKFKPDKVKFVILSLHFLQI